GGGKFSYSILANKSKISFKSPKKIISDIIKLKKLEVSNIMISCESNLNNWCEVLTELEEKNIYVDIMFEDWQLPKKEFTKVMCSYANKTGSGFLVSVLSGNENIRKKNGKNFSNEELLEVATIISKTEKSYLCCWFAPNLVGGTKKHFQETIIFAKKLIELNRVSKKSNINVLISPMEVDITSNIYSHPSAYNFSGKLWDYEYLIKLLRFRDSGVKLGNMSYVSKDMSIEECNKLCEQFDKEILLLKEEINKTILN
ncbi:MAG: hypothetical protein KKF89_01765, partial [Nanoarchaeota archaeon]|nr:hypothetical protein [Nanoarchaeota archaeon]MBU1854424.1 hypothetical protein [Nanoarchaeota archaeon]